MTIKEQIKITLRAQYAKRIQELNDIMTSNYYREGCRSLYEDALEKQAALQREIEYTASTIMMRWTEDSENKLPV